MICLEYTVNGFVPLSSQPVDYSTCSYVLHSGLEASGSLFSLNADQGAQIALAIGSIWAIGAVIRIVISLLRPSAVDSTEHS